MPTARRAHPAGVVRLSASAWENAVRSSTTSRESASTRMHLRLERLQIGVTLVEQLGSGNLGNRHGKISHRVGHNPWIRLDRTPSSLVVAMER